VWKLTPAGNIPRVCRTREFAASAAMGRRNGYPRWSLPEGLRQVTKGNVYFTEPGVATFAFAK